MSDTGEPRVYEALALPSEALSEGGVEILRAGVINDELYVTARRAFKDPSKWGEALGDIARRIAAIYSLDDNALSEKDIVADIVEAFASEMGLQAVQDKRKPTTRRARPKQKRSAKKAAKKAARKSAKRRKR